MMALACDLGGTRMKIGVVRDGRVLAQTIRPSESKQGLALQLPVLKAAWLGLLAELRLSLRHCDGISVSFPSLVDTATGRVLTEYGKFADAPALDLRAWANDELGLVLAIENDARMALVGEWRAGAGRGVDNLAMITLGTGLGTAAVMEGRLLRGQHGQAGVLGGHSTVRYGGRTCSCGNIGCAEAEASTAFLADLARGTAEFAGSSMRDAATLDYELIFKHAAAGDACAAGLRDHSLRVWSALAVNLVHAYDPELLILGGGIMAAAEVVLPAIREYVARHAHTPWGKVRVAPSELGDQAALVAAEWLLEEQLGADACRRTRAAA
ncbi:MAG TPA: ROK family protein [Dongiaceae bacterium]|nr:ROK family protein [Dongiaceae bacterium]